MNKPEKAKLQKILITYLKEIHKIYTEGNFREESFYPALKELFENCSGLFLEEGDAGVLVLPKKTEVGIPDFLIRKDGEGIGYIEAKTLDSNLQEVISIKSSILMVFPKRCGSIKSAVII
jgi:hypothetical protein